MGSDAPLSSANAAAKAVVLLVGGLPAGILLSHLWREGVDSDLGDLAPYALAVSLYGAVVGVVWAAPRYRRLAILPGFLGGLGVFVACCLYLTWRQGVYTLELLAPIVAGVFPAILLFQALVRFRHKRAARPDGVEADNAAPSAEPTADDLGELVRSHGQDQTGVQQNVIAGVLFVVLAPVIMAFLAKNKQEARVNELVWVLLVAGEAIALGYLVIKLRQRKWRVELYQAGFVSIRRSKVLAARWEDVTSVRENRVIGRGFGAHTFHTVTVALNDGRVVAFNRGYEDIAGLANAIQHQALRRQFPKALEALRNQQPVTFGDLTLTSRGFGYAGEEVAFNQIKDVRIVTGEFQIRKSGRFLCWYSRSVGHIPNYERSWRSLSIGE